MEKYINDTELMPQKGSKPEIEELISQIVKDSTLIHLGKQDLNYLYREKEVLKCRIYSFPYKNETRMEAILREVVEYSQVDFMRYNRVILLIKTSSKVPLLMNELGFVNEIIKKFPEKVDVKWGLGWDNTIDDKVFLMMICSY
jgi:hypothetical protein